jgi:hypothetical protein
MNEQQPVPEEEVDQLVRAYLQQRTACSAFGPPSGHKPRQRPAHPS